MHVREGSQPPDDGVELWDHRASSGEEMQCDETNDEAGGASVLQSHTSKYETKSFSQIQSDGHAVQINQTEQSLPPSRSKKSKKDLELEKELASLQPFYYDR